MSVADPESGQTIIKGMGELHLEIKVDILKRTHKVEVNVGAPQVAYRETLARSPRSTTRTRSRPAVPASLRASSSAWSRTRRGPATSSRARSSAAWCRRNTSPVSRRASQSVSGLRRADRLSHGGHEGDAVRRRLSRGELVGHRLRDRCAPGHARGLREGRRPSCSSRSWTSRW